MDIYRVLGVVLIDLKKCRPLPLPAPKGLGKLKIPETAPIIDDELRIGITGADQVRALLPDAASP